MDGEIFVYMLYVYILYFLVDGVLWFICLIKRRGKSCMYASVLLIFHKTSKDVDFVVSQWRTLIKYRGVTARLSAHMKQNSISKSNIRSFSDIITRLLDENSSTPSEAHENRNSFLFD